MSSKCGSESLLNMSVMSPTDMRRQRALRLIRRSAIIGAIVIFVLSSLAAALIYAYGQADRAAPADVIIILGSGTLSDGSPTVGQTRRVQHGVALYKQGFAPLILCTGGYTKQHPKSEAQTCVDLAESLGVPASALLMEEKSLSTEENAIYSQKVMQAEGLKTALLVSDNFHLLRAEMLFRVYGIHLAGSSPAQITTGPLFVGTVIQGSYREVLAFVWYAVKTALHLPYTDVSL